MLGVQWTACYRCDLTPDSVNSQRVGWCFAIFWGVLVAQESLLPRLCLPVGNQGVGLCLQSSAQAEEVEMCWLPVSF